MRHSLSFRGEDHAIPAGSGLCTACGALLQIEAWLVEECPGRALIPRCDCPEHACTPDRAQAERYPVEGGRQLCAFCYAHGHGAPLRLRYAGLLP